MRNDIEISSRKALKASKNDQPQRVFANSDWSRPVLYE